MPISISDFTIVTLITEFCKTASYNPQLQIVGICNLQYRLDLFDMVIQKVDYG